MVARFLVAGSVFLSSIPLTHAADATSYVVNAAKTHGVPVQFALRVAKAESGIKCGVHNRRSGATGPMQILPSTARSLGYRNIRQAACPTQVSAGMKYLAYCLKITRHNHYNAARCYNGGPGALKSNSRSAHRYASKVTR